LESMEKGCKVAFLGFNLRARAVSAKLRKAGVSVIWIVKPFDVKYENLGIDVGKTYCMPWISKQRRRRVSKLYALYVTLLYPLYVFLLVPLVDVNAIYIIGNSVRNPIILNLLVSFFKKVRKKVIYEVGDIPVIYEKEVRGKNIPEFIERILLRNLFVSYTKTDLLIAGSLGGYDFARENCKKFGGCKKILVSYYGADLRLFNRRISPYGIRQQYNLTDSFLIGWIGTGGNEKKVIPVVEALSQHFKGKNISFVIGGGVDYERLKKIERSTGVRIICLGRVSQDTSGKIYKECDLIIVPLDFKKSFYHIAFSTKIFEATAIGKPVVATVPKSNLEMVRNLPNVIIVDDQPQSFVTAVQDVLEHYSKYGSISKHLQSDVINRISIQCSAEMEVKHIIGLIEK